MVLLNSVFQKELELLYGKGSIVEINDFRYCTNNKNFSIDCTLKISDVNSYSDIDIDGLRFLIDESWKYTGMGKNKITLISSVDIL
jgi:hypothetical protein